MQRPDGGEISFVLGRRSTSLTHSHLGRQPLGYSRSTMKPHSTKSIRKRSERTFAGLPLFDIAYGPDADQGERSGKAHGIIAVGNEARGWLALGDSARGYVAVGGKARGLIALGGKAIGLIAVGGMSLGVIALGGLAFGAIAMGGLAAGGIAVGGRSVGFLSVDKRRGRKSGNTSI
jgi:hypothetical protein